MLVLKSRTAAKAEIKGAEGTAGDGGVTLSGSMTRQVGSSGPRESLMLMLSDRGGFTFDQCGGAYSQYRTNGGGHGVSHGYSLTP